MAEEVAEPKGSDRITVRVPEEMIKIMQRWVELENKDGTTYKNISDVIRKSLDFVIKYRTPPEGVVNKMISIPKRRIVELEELVSIGEIIDIDYGIQKAIEEFIEKRVHLIKKDNAITGSEVVSKSVSR
ncbi:MAG: hypothetical protein M1481_07115 [Candidatus Thermoplasmatota archaeon]|jgi:hypothetical protein|nr:hypothetical protein [Candidatus Thermoplasmatota archaeon]MCL5963699.1 hypothetical protein [Candidatus Thermoplasmatota archaeon]